MARGSRAGQARGNPPRKIGLQEQLSRLLCRACPGLPRRSLLYGPRMRSMGNRRVAKVQEVFATRR